MMKTLWIFQLDSSKIKTPRANNALSMNEVLNKVIICSNLEREYWKNPNISTIAAGFKKKRQNLLKNLNMPFDSNRKTFTI